MLTALVTTRTQPSPTTTVAGCALRRELGLVGMSFGGRRLVRDRALHAALRSGRTQTSRPRAGQPA